MKNNIDSENSRYEVIDLQKIILSFWFNKITIIKITLLFSISGFFYSIMQKDVFKSSSTFYPHYENNENSNIQNLAGLAGVNLNSNVSNEVPTNLYPNLVRSTPFKQSILNQKINANNTEITYRDYLIMKEQENNSKPTFKLVPGPL